MKISKKSWNVLTLLRWAPCWSGGLGQILGQLRLQWAKERKGVLFEILSLFQYRRLSQKEKKEIADRMWPPGTFRKMIGKLFPIRKVLDGLKNTGDVVRQKVLDARKKRTTQKVRQTFFVCLVFFDFGLFCGEWELKL